MSQNKRNPKPTSFISERTAEYILIPELVKILTPHFSKVIPLYFNSMREGSNISRSCNPFQLVRLVTIYARRPKIRFSGKACIEVKLNSLLFQTAASAKRYNIPVFAGAPLASSIFDLNSKIQCKWFEFSGEEEDGDVFYQFSFDGKELSRSANSHRVAEISETMLVEKILQKSQPIEWHNAILHLKDMRRENTGVWSFGLWSIYRPFHLLLID